MSEDAPKGEQLIDEAGPDDRQYYSVTTLLRAMGSQGLIEWGAREVAGAALDNLGYLPTKLEHEGRQACINWLADARFRRDDGKRTATELGQAVHAACEHYALVGSMPEVDDEVAPFVDQFVRWMNDFRPQFEAAEMTVYSDRYGYAGTLDAIATVYGKRFVIDYKSSRDDRDKWGNLRTPYADSVALQLAAYRYADKVKPTPPRRFEKWRRRYYLLNPTEAEDCVPVPEVDAGLCIYITPDRCDAYPVTCDINVHRRFLYVAEIWRWQNQVSRNAMGEPLALVLPGGC